MPTRPAFHVPSSLSLLLLLVLPILGCGSKTQTIKIKDYRLALVSRSNALNAEFKRLSQEFNQAAGMTVLNYVDDAAQANSPIVMTKGLEAKTDGKIGLGQWISQTDSELPLALTFEPTRQDTIKYSMRLEFDADYFASRMGFDDQVKQYEKQKVFFHEVGHGLEMDHNAGDSRDVMYPKIVGEKDFDAFFAKVRAYMRDRG